MQGLKFRGRPPIRIADSVKDVVNGVNPYTAAILDRTISIDQEFVDAIIGQSIFSWEGRNPSPALDEDGEFVGTDLDLLSFLAPLAARRAVIEFPKYTAHRASKLYVNERRISTPSRFGTVTNLNANQKFFSFSLRMVDQSVLVRDPVTGRETPGAFRNFMVVGPDGTWHDGWKRIIFSPTAEENQFLTAKGLWTGNTVVFKNAVHPNRWQSVYGAPYLLLKMLIERLSDEYSYYAGVVKALRETFELPAGEVSESAPYVGNGVETQKITVNGLECVLDLPEFAGRYPAVMANPEGLLQAHRRAKLLRYTLKPQAQVIVRADELAFFKYGLGKVAPWLGTRSFKDYKAPGKRIVWQQMVLSNDVSWRWREREISDNAAVRNVA